VSSRHTAQVITTREIVTAQATYLTGAREFRVIDDDLPENAFFGTNLDKEAAESIRPQCDRRSHDESNSLISWKLVGDGIDASAHCWK
jgi:hypothetical protein